MADHRATSLGIQDCTCDGQERRADSSGHLQLHVRLRIPFPERLLTFFYRNGLNMRPQPFQVSIKPRSERIRQAIVREGELALADLAPYEGETRYRMSTFYSSKK